MGWQLQHFNPTEFIRHYWQKKPGLFRNAFDDPQMLITPEELAGLACEEAVHSRLILESGGTHPWQLRYGPFEESDFTSLPASHYSLLVSECEKWIPEFSALQSQFEFIPSWRLDDVMISYAPPGGSVGAHVDEYDVFLIQLSGQRRWRYTQGRLCNAALLPGLDLAILKSFTPDYDEVLNPGDMLYLPPGVAHHGVALENCMTCSIGFRAPTALETLESYMHEIDDRKLGEFRYSDSDLEVRSHPAEITAREVQRFRKMAVELLDQSDDIWVDSVAKLLTDTLPHDEIQTPVVENIDDLSGVTWVNHCDSRLLYYRSGSEIRFYVNGRLSILPDTPGTLLFVQHICGGFPLDAGFIESIAAYENLAGLLLSMINKGIIVELSSY